MTDVTVKFAPLARGGTYRAWASKMRALLLTQGRLDRLLDQAPVTEEEVERDELCKARLLLHVSGPLADIVERQPTAHAAWTKLHKEYMGDLRARQPLLLDELHTLKQGKDTIVQYSDKALRMRDEFMELSLESSLPLLHQSFITGLSDELRSFLGPQLYAVASKEGNGLEEVVDELRTLAELLPPSVAHANVTSTRDDGSGRKDASDRGRVDSRRCFACGQMGHLERNCPMRNRRPQQGDNAIAMCVGGQATASKVAALDPSALWFDTAATHHIVHDQSLLQNHQAAAVKTVSLGGGEEHSVLCQGDLLVKGGPSGPIRFSGVLCVPTLNLNLCSGPQVTAKGGQCWQGGDTAVISDSKGRTLLRGHKAGGMYKLKCTLPQPEASVHATTSGLWHKRLGHPGDRVVEQLIKSGLTRLVGKEEGSCEVCDSAKQTRESYGRSDSVSSCPLDLIHSDLLTMPLEALEGERYVLTILDDYSRYSAVVCIRRKSDVTDELIACAN